MRETMIFTHINGLTSFTDHEKSTLQEPIEQVILPKLFLVKKFGENEFVKFLHDFCAL